jgi:hypothetical protein
MMVQKSQEQQPRIGMGVTISIGSDRQVGTITRIISKHRVAFTYDDVIQDGSGNARSITTVKGAQESILIHGKKGWKIMNQPFRATIGDRNFYYDLAF